MRKTHTTILAILIPIAVGVSISVYGVHRKNANAPRSVTLGKMFGVGYGSKLYHDKHGRWPESISVVMSESNPTVDWDVYPDAWGTPMSYQPFDPERGYGGVTSFGRDGVPGGAGLDADLTFQFNAETSQADMIAGPDPKLRMKVTDPPPERD